MSQGEAPPPRKRRLWLLVAVLAVASLVAATVLLRESLATRAAIAYLEGQGVAVRSLAVTRLTPRGAEVRQLVLGDHRELAAQSVAVRWTWPGLQPQVTGVDITGLRLYVDIAEGKAPLGSLQPVLERFAGTDGETGGADAAAPETAAPAETAPLPPVAVNDALVIFQTPSGPMSATLSGGLGPADDGGLLAEAALNLDSELGRLQAHLNGRRGPDGTLNLEAEIAEGRFAWSGFALGSLAGTLNFTRLPESGPALQADLGLRDLAYSPPEGTPLQLQSGTLQARGDLGDFDLSLDLDGDGESLTLNLDSGLAETPEGRRIDVSLQGEARSAGGLAQLLPLPGAKAAAGTLVLQGEGNAALPAGTGLPDSLRTLVATLADSSLHLQAEAILAEVALTDGTEGLSAHLPLVVESNGGTLTLALSDDAAVRLEHPARDSLRDLGVPDDLLPLLASGLNLTLVAKGDQPFRVVAVPAWPPREAEIALAGKANSDQGLSLAAQIAGKATLDDRLSFTGFTGKLATRAEAPSLSLGGREGRDLVVSLPLAMAYGAGGLALSLAEPGTLRLGQFGAGAPLRLEAPLNFTISSMTLKAATATEGYNYSLRGEEDGAAFAVTAADRAPIAITAGALTLTLDGRFDPQAGHDADFAARLGGLSLPGYGFTADGVELDVALDRELRPESSRIALKPFRIGDGQPKTAPLSLTGDLKRQRDGYDLTAELALNEGPALADISGRYADDGRGQVEAASKVLSFAPDGLQPAQISPLLADLEDVRGTVTASARLAWPRNPAQEQGKLTVSGLSFGGPAEVEGLDLSLALSNLLPPASQAGQRLTVRRLEAGVPVEDIEIDFSLDPKPQLDVAKGGFDLGGARWYIDPVQLDPAAERNRIVLGTEALDLATFFRLIGVDGLSGSGTLKGSLPVVFAEGDVIVDDGRFEALGPGRLSIRFEALRSALAGGGETVELAIKALEDFHYETLSLTLSKTAANDATVRLSTLGQNPEVLDGQPFQFNINLESNLTSVLEALRQGYSLSDEALRRAWQLSE